MHSSSLQAYLIAHLRTCIKVRVKAYSLSSSHISSINLWNKCISKLLDNPDLLSLSHRSHLIIPGHNVNSDLTILMGTFKNRLKNFLLKTQNLGITSDWSQQQKFICLTCIKIISCGLYLFPTAYIYIYLYIWILFYSYG